MSLGGFPEIEPSKAFLELWSKQRHALASFESGLRILDFMRI